MISHNKRVEIGIIGAGGVTEDLHLPVLINMPEINIAWLCDKNLNTAKALAKRFNIKRTYDAIEKCSDVDIVLIAIPVGFRREVMDKVIERGWNLFCEKPFAVSLDEHQEYIKTADAKGVQSCIGLVRRYCPATSKARELIKKNVFGKIVSAWASEGFRTKRTGREAGWYIADPKAVGGGILMETGTHLVDQLCFILGVDSYKLEGSYQKKYQGLDYETRFVGTVNNEMQENIRCAFEVSRISDLCNGIFIQFEKYLLKCGLGFESPLELCDPNGALITEFQLEPVSENAAFYYEWIDCIEQSKNGLPSTIDAKTGIVTTAIIEQCYLKSQEFAEDNKNG